MSFGVYIHVPFCKSKCPYCDFYSVIDRDKGLKEQYTEALLKEIGNFSRYFEDKEENDHIFMKQSPDSVYFGGGTPSVLEPEQLKRILDKVDETFPVSEDREVTIEVNPGTVDGSFLEEIRKTWFNRLSIGAQSFDDAVLKKLGRLHRTGDTLKAFREAREAGFTNISLDLIFGIEGQTMKTWEDSLKKVMELRPEHISLYSLEFMENTVFTRMLMDGRMKETDPETDRAMYEKAVEFLTECGYEHYEISNFALPGYESRHNLKYWDLDDYAGFGPGAHSYMTDLTTGQGQRFYHQGNLERYLSAPEGVEMMEPNGYADDMTEYVITALRLKKGISKSAFSERFGQDFWEFYGNLAHLQFRSFIDTGHAFEDEDIIRLTLKGFNVSNQILSLFV